MRRVLWGIFGLNLVLTVLLFFRIAQSRRNPADPIDSADLFKNKVVQPFTNGETMSNPVQQSGDSQSQSQSQSPSLSITNPRASIQATSSNNDPNPNTPILGTPRASIISTRPSDKPLTVGPANPTTRLSKDIQLFPIAVVAAYRGELLRECLQSLLALAEINKALITVYQDGDDASVAKVCKTMDVRLVQNTEPYFNTNNQDGARRIARHYKFTFTHAFKDYPDHDYLIVVEEDMIFSPDFLRYFSQLAPLYKDPKTFCITSWNDNGFKDMAVDTSAMYRTDFFVGLGWLLSKKIYKDELEARWPALHWDHWMREDARRKGRHCLYPEVSRNFNIGKKGVHSSEGFWNEFFKNIVYNTDPNAELRDISHLYPKAYDERLTNQIRAAAKQGSVHPRDLCNAKWANTNSSLAVLFNLDNAHNMDTWESGVAPMFKLWHSVPFIRNMYMGVVITRHCGNTIFLIATTSSFVELVKGHQAYYTTDFLPGTQQATIIAGAQGASCQAVCKGAGLACHNQMMGPANTCEELEKAFKCKLCIEDSSGEDQPALDVAGAQPGTCIRSTLKQLNCQASHPATRRLCACY